MTELRNTLETTFEQDSSRSFLSAMEESLELQTRKSQKSPSPELLHESLPDEEGKLVLTQTANNPSDPFEVQWDGDDRENMKNISHLRKWIYSLILIAGALQVTANSSAWSTAQTSIIDHFGCSTEVATLGLSLYVVALGVGPLFTAPLSEFYGRRTLYAASFVVYVGFQFATSFGSNIGTLLVGRTISALGGGILLASVPGTFTDMFQKHELGLPMAVFTLGPFLGPGLGPLIAGFIDATIGFRWIFYLFLIWSGAVAVSGVFLVPETFPPLLLKEKAKRLRKITGNNKFYAPIERQDMNILRAIAANCTRPIILVVREPMLALLCLYTGFILAVVYLFFVAFPIVFEEVYHFRIQFVGMSFLGITIGMALGMLTSFWWAALHAKAVARNNGMAEPEFRLPQMCTGSVIIPVGLFMFAWTIYSSVHWIVPIVASGIFGVGLYYTFNGILSYTVEAYRQFAASTLAANVFIRCTIAGAFPLFGRQMMYKLGFHWAISLLGFISILLCPSSFLFLKYGKSLRQRSKYAYA